jgi:hypothetical protein
MDAVLLVSTFFWRCFSELYLPGTVHAALRISNVIECGNILRTNRLRAPSDYEAATVMPPKLTLNDYIQTYWGECKLQSTPVQFAPLRQWLLLRDNKLGHNYVWQVSECPGYVQNKGAKFVPLSHGIRWGRIIR